ncbi:MAG: 6-carboxytetrahydropterin synthase QueD [Ruminococcus sp.]|nr:6-carboxytetrahydropterin synthase QueD [Ruminococcus sp.]
MYGLKTSAAFDSAHFLKDYNGKCANIHGHRWVIEAEISGEELQNDGEKRGMLLDFSDFKVSLKSLADEFDHALIIEINSLKENTLNALKDEGFRVIEVPFRPTAENFARCFYQRLSSNRLPVSVVTVYETPQNCACYKEND